MRINNLKKETAQQLINRAVRQAKRGFDIRAISSKETILLESRVNPSLIKALEQFVGSFDWKKKDDLEYKKVMNWRLKTIFSSFTMTDDEVKLFMSGWINRANSYTYNLLEAYHTIMLIIDDEYRKTFMQDCDIFSTKQQIGYSEYMLHYNGWVLHVDKLDGTIHKLDHHFTFDEIVDLSVDTKSGTVDVLTKAGATHRVYEDRELVGDWVLQNGTKTDGSKTYGKVQLSTKLEDKYGKGYYIVAHQLIAGCEWGYNILKFCRGSIKNSSIFTIDHINNDKLCNNIDNLRLMPRTDNTNRKTKSGYTTDWCEFFNRVEEDKIEYKQYKDYFDLLDANIAI